MKRSKKKIVRFFLAISKIIFPKSLYAKILFFRGYKKFKKEINKTLSKKKFSDKLDSINHYEYKITSQNNEDGIIEHIFSKIPNQKKFVEIGFDFYEFNSLNLIKNGWNGKLIDINSDECLVLNSLLKNFFPNSKVLIDACRVTKENVNNVVFSWIEDKIDFFSIDIDGNDYWILDSLNLNKINVICCEYNHWLGKNVKKTMPYQPNHNFKNNGYYGASLLAISNLLNKKGFDLIAVESSGTNAFFVNKKFSSNFNILSVAESWKPGGRFDSEKKKREIIYNLKNFKFLNVD